MTWLADRRAVPLLLFLLVWLSTGWFASWELNPNNSTRLFAAISLAEQGDATIDEFAPLTIDKAQFDGHVYLDKAPGMTLLATPVVAAAFVATGQGARHLDKQIGNAELARYLRLRLRLAAWLVTGLITALATIALWSFARALTGDEDAALFASLAYALATPIWGWSTTLFGHAPVAGLWMIAIWAIWRGTQMRASAGLALIAGAALGWAVAIEYQAVLGSAVIGLWALSRLWRRPGALPAALAAIAGGGTALAALIGYNLLAFGVLFRFGYSGVVGFEGMQQGFFGLTYPKPLVLLALLFGVRRGLIWVAPVLLRGGSGMAALWQRERALAAMLIVLALTVLLVNSSYVYWDGGYSTGPRHSVPAITPLAIAVAVTWTTIRTRPGRAAALALLALSAAVNLVITATDMFAPDDAPFPLWDPILKVDFAQGMFRDLPGEFWGWTHWTGLALYVLVAGALLAALLVAQRTRQRAHANIYRTNGAAQHPGKA